MEISGDAKLTWKTIRLFARNFSRDQIGITNQDVRSFSCHHLEDGNILLGMNNVKYSKNFNEIIEIKL